MTYLNRENYTGLLASVVGHLLILSIILLKGFTGNNLIPQTIYSVTVEGGKSLGKIAQVPTKERTEIAPPKMVSSASQKKMEVAPKDAEISLSDKKKREKAKPTPKPTPKVKPTPKKADPSAALNKQLEQAVQRYLGESTDAGGTGFGAGALGGNKQGGGVVRPPEFFMYKKLLETSIKEGWKWYDTNAPIIAQVRFQISPNGEISLVTLVKSSGVGEYDQSVLRAVNKASPVPAPPQSVYEFFKDVVMTFDPRE